MNFIHIAGHLGADPEVRFTTTGKKVTNFNVATRSSRKGKNGEEVTMWWRITIWGDQFDKMVSFLKKGSAVIVHGDLHKESFTNREGKQQESFEITASSIEFSPFGKPSGAAPSQPAAAPAQVQPAGAVQGQGSTFDDEVPF
jgi:single-strand DNA-binding protein